MAAQPSRHHVFETFKLERSSPDLQDVLVKKNALGKPLNTAADAKRKSK